MIVGLPDFRLYPSQRNLRADWGHEGLVSSANASLTIYIIIFILHLISCLISASDINAPIPLSSATVITSLLLREVAEYLNLPQTHLCIVK